MAFDYKKEYKEFYMPPKKPGIVEVPEMRFLAVPCAAHLDHSQSSPSRYAYAPRGRQGAAAPVQVVTFNALRVLQTGPSVNSL